MSAAQSWITDNGKVFWRGREGFGHQKEEHGQRKEHGDLEWDLLAALHGQQEAERRHTGRQHAREHHGHQVEGWTTNLIVYKKNTIFKSQRNTR